MPELAEVRLTAEYVQKISRGKIFHGVWKNPEHKGKGFEIPHPFIIDATARGKEMKISLDQAPNFFRITKHNSETSLSLMVTLGMSGRFVWSDSDWSPKHTHLKFISNWGQLCFVDVRRFGRWAFGSWNPDRGPDPTLDFEEFKIHVLSNLKSKAFQKPIHEVLMNQKFFNGIGNYLRAEILYRIDCDPFLPAKDYITQHPIIFDLCRDLPTIAYTLGGGRIKDWKNPDGKIPTNWDEFMLCYGNPLMSKITDKNGRTFWFDPKWNTKK
jgi:endonuclease VIII-like 1